MALVFRGPPYQAGTPTTQPWGAGQGSNLTPDQTDDNFYYLLTLIQDLQASQGAGISYFVINGNLLYVHLTNHQVLGPYTLPMWTPIPTGEWQPDTQYYSNNVVYWAGATYLITYNHISPSVFNPYYEVGGNACYSPPILVVPEGQFTYQETGHPVDGQVMTYVEAGNYWTNETQSGGVALSDPVSISSSQLQDLTATPVLVLPAPGAGLMISIIQVFYSFAAGVDQYVAASPQAGLYYAASSSNAADAGDNSAPVNAASALEISPGAGSYTTSLFALSAVENQSISYCNFGGAYTHGNGTMNIRVLYALVEVP